MPIYNLLRHLAQMAVVTVLALMATLTPVSAQGFSLWPGDWFGNSQAQPALPVLFPDHIRPGEIIASFIDRRLYYVYARGRAISYPIATPRPDSQWEGVMKISQKRVNPRWIPTPEMRAENPDLPDYVPGGDARNPLGNRALYLGTSLYRIHGTDAPWTIGQPVSKGCIRMYNRDVADLYERVGVGTKVTATWKSYSYY